MTPPTQQELEALRVAAKAALWAHFFSKEWGCFERMAANPASIIAILDLIAARDKEIAELKAQVGHARERGYKDDGMMM